MKAWTRTELEALNMDEAQISAILKQQGIVERDENVINGTTVIPMGEIIKRKEDVFTGFDESQITTISDIHKYSQGTIVKLPAFDGDNPFIAKLRRPSLLVMVKSGKIPNSLINQATQLFQKGASGLGKDNTLGDMYDIMEAVCEAALVKPTYKDIKNAGLNLTDEQMMAIFSYTQQGVKALEQFR